MSWDGLENRGNQMEASRSFGLWFLEEVGVYGILEVLLGSVGEFRVEKYLDVLGVRVFRLIFL